MICENISQSTKVTDFGGLMNKKKKGKKTRESL